VENVFHTAPHASKKGSGVCESWQHHVLEGVGCHSQSGQRIRPNASSSSGRPSLSMTGAVIGLFFSIQRIVPVDSGSIAADGAGRAGGAGGQASKEVSVK
jgi:hypothetical protein